MPEQDVTHLMELLRDTAGFSYVSDLHDPTRADKLLAAVGRIPCADFPAAAWNDLIRYITMEQARFTAPEEAAAYLCERLAAMDTGER